MEILTEQEFKNNDEIIRKSIAETVVNKRKDNGWTRYELSKRCGVSHHAITKIENADGFDIRTLLRVLKCLGIKMMFL